MEKIAQDTGMDTLAFALRASLQRACNMGVFSAAVVGVIDESARQQSFSLGVFPSQSKAVAVHDRSVFDVASVTKSLPIATLALQALERVEIELDLPVCNLVTELSGAYRKLVTVRHLLTHTLQWKFALSSVTQIGAAGVLEKVFQLQLAASPGSTYFYSNATSVLLGVFLQRLYNLPIPQLAAQNIFEPLQMHDTTFFPAQRFAPQCLVATENDPWRGRTIQGEVHDEGSFALQQLGIFGAAGLFSTCKDLLRFLAAVCHQESVFSRRFLLQTIAKNYLAPNCPAQSALGFERNPVFATGAPNPILAKTGFTGALIAFDPLSRRGLVALSNYTWPRRKSSVAPIQQFRNELCAAVFGAKRTSF